MQWHWILRYPVRIPVFFMPAGLLYKSIDDEMKKLFLLHMKYYTRIVKTRRTGDLRYLDPNGILAR